MPRRATRHLPSDRCRRGRTSKSSIKGSVYGHSGLGGDGQGALSNTFIINVPLPSCVSAVQIYAQHPGHVGGDALVIPNGGHSVEIDNTGGVIFGGGSGGSGGLVTVVEYFIGQARFEELRRTGAGGGGGQGSDGDAAAGGELTENLDCARPSYPQLVGNPGIKGTPAAAGNGGEAVNSQAPDNAGLIGETWGIGGSFGVRFNGNSVQITGTGTANLKGATG